MATPHRSEPDLTVLHTLRCIGTASVDRVASSCGMRSGDVDGRLDTLSRRGLVTHLPGPFGGWELTDAGRTNAQELVEAEMEGVNGRDEVRRSYESFLTLNPSLLQVCHDWQMRKIGPSQVLNDHTDRDYDAGVLSRLIRIDGEAQAICADLANHLARFDVYGGRLSTALERAIAGDNSSVSDNLDSYHTVWFQLHEDLLATLGISRHDESRDRPNAG